MLLLRRLRQTRDGGILGNFRARLADVAAAIDKDHIAEIDFFLACERMRRRAAFDIHLPFHHRRYARVDIDLDPLDTEFSQPQPLLDAFGDLLAQVDGITLRPAVISHKRERHCRFAVTERNRLGGFDLFQHTLRFGRKRRRGAQERQRGGQQKIFQAHTSCSIDIQPLRRSTILPSASTPTLIERT